MVVVILVGAAGAGFFGDGEQVEQPSTENPQLSETPQKGDPAETTLGPKSETQEPPESLESNLTFEFDTLQNGFISISENTTIEEILLFIDENSLFYTAQEYNKTSGGKTIQYRIAYKKEVSYQRYSDSGDYLEISFDKNNENKILNAQYVSSHSPGYSALFYNYGTWYDFRDGNAEDYSGYYNVKSLGGNNEGIVVKYNNGNEAHTNYFLCDSPEEAIENILKEVGN